MTIDGGRDWRHLTVPARLRSAAAGAIAFTLLLTAGGVAASLDTRRHHEQRHEEAHREAQALATRLDQVLAERTEAVALVNAALPLETRIGTIRFDAFLRRALAHQPGIVAIALEQTPHALTIQLRPAASPVSREIITSTMASAPSGVAGPFAGDTGPALVVWQGPAAVVIDLLDMLSVAGVADTARTAVRVDRGTDAVHGDGGLFSRGRAVTAVSASGTWHVAVRPLADIPPLFLAIMGLAGGVGLLAALLVEKLVRELLDRRRAEQEVQASRRRLTDVLETSSDWVWEADAEGRFVFLSEPLGRLLRRPTSDLLGKTRWDMAATEADLRTLTDLQAVIDARRPFRNVDYSTRLEDGSIRHLRISGRPRFAADGDFIGYIGAGSDVTEEKTAAARAQEAETRLLLAIEGMAEGIALFDVTGRLTLHNGRLRRLLTDAGGAPFTEDATLEALLLSVAIDADSVRRLLSNRFANQLKPLRLHTRGDRWLICRMAPSRDNGILTLWADITHEVRARKEAERLERERRHAQKLEAIGTLAGGIAHEINTPIQYIGDNLRFLRDAFTDLQTVLAAADPLRADAPALDDAWRRADLDFLRDEVPQALDQSLDGIRNVAGIVLAMKEFAHPSARDPIPFDANHALQTTATVSRNEWKHVAAITYDLTPDLPPVIGLPGEINQVLLNLIVNAAHAVTEAGRTEGLIALATRVVEDSVEITVSDNGTGIPESIRERIFDPFFTTKPVGKGTGQGLAIAHDIVVHKHRGSITVDSEPGRGTTFTIRLPAVGEGAGRDAA